MSLHQVSFVGLLVALSPLSVQNAVAEAEWFVQIASKPSAEQARAAYNDLVGRFSLLIGERSVTITKAFVGDRGPFWRVRLPAQTREQAQKLCEDYKAAGGNCFVVRDGQPDLEPSGGLKPLTEADIASIRGQIQRCWSIPADVAMKVKVQFQLAPDGNLIGSPKVVDGGGKKGAARAAAEAARRAVTKCAPYKMPPEKYASWANVVVTFDPSDLF